MVTKCVNSVNQFYNYCTVYVGVVTNVIYGQKLQEHEFLTGC